MHDYVHFPAGQMTSLSDLYQMCMDARAAGLPAVLGPPTGLQPGEQRMGHLTPLDNLDALKSWYLHVLVNGTQGFRLARQHIYLLRHHIPQAFVAEIVVRPNA